MSQRRPGRPPAATEGSVGTPPTISESALTTDEGLYVSILTRHTGLTRFTPLSYALEGSLKPMFLNQIPRPPPDWQFRGKVILIAFHSQPFTEIDPGSSAMTTTPASDTPVDVHARPFVAQWSGNSDLSEFGCADAIANIKIVYRWNYECRGACCIQEDGSDWEHGEEDNVADERPEVPAVTPETLTMSKPTRWQSCATGVKLIIEIHADDLTRANIWQYRTHADANPGYLVWSRRLRNIVSERFRLVGAKATNIMRGLDN
ncbi:hypothetical protein JB92DRAFT_2824447 [Gautieria morchelliformis]|nr:hypothetical protein JB92DRAFT_2824447 [Gautieria morchelliformis]